MTASVSPLPPAFAAIPFLAPPAVWHNGRHEVAMGVVPLAWLRPAPYNPRTMSDDARQRLELGLDAFGVVDPLIAAEDGELLGGHQRHTAETYRGATHVPVLVVAGLTPEERATVNVLLNNPNAQGQWDLPKLTALLSEIDGNGFDATLTGFSSAELEKLLAPEERPLDTEALDAGDDRADAPRYDVVVRCASATEQQATVERLTAQGYTCAPCEVAS